MIVIRKLFRDCKIFKNFYKVKFTTHLFFRSSLNPDERKVYGDSPFFGINLGVDQCGSIKIGDKVNYFNIIEIVSIEKLILYLYIPITEINIFL